MDNLGKEDFKCYFSSLTCYFKATLLNQHHFLARLKDLIYDFCKLPQMYITSSQKNHCINEESINTLK